LNETQKEGKAMSDPAVMETRKQNGEPLFQLSADEILAVQEMRKRKAQEKEAPASRQELKFTVPTTLPCPNCGSLLKRDQEYNFWLGCERCGYGKKERKW
jgi:ribosomal protein S27AE